MAFWDIICMHRIKGKDRKYLYYEVIFLFLFFLLNLILIELQREEYYKVSLGWNLNCTSLVEFACLILGCSICYCYCLYRASPFLVSVDQVNPIPKKHLTVLLVRIITLLCINIYQESHIPGIVIGSLHASTVICLIIPVFRVRKLQDLGRFNKLTNITWLLSSRVCTCAQVLVKF